MPSSFQFLPVANEAVDVLQHLHTWLGDGQGNLDTEKGAALAQTMYPNNAVKRANFEALLADAWTKQKNAYTDAITLFVGV